MPIAPVAGKDFRTSNGLRAVVLQEGPADTQNRRFFGFVRVNGAFTYTLWRATGVNPSNVEWNIEADWPTASAIRYMAIMPTQDGAFRVMGPIYADLGALRAEWKPKGCAWYLTANRNAQNEPTATVSALT